MGSFYTNVTLRGPKQDDILSAMRGREAYVSSTVNEFTVIYDAQSEEQDIETLSNLAAMLSKKLKCAALAILNHDDDILYYQLYNNGKFEDEYNSSPDYFESVDEFAGPEGGDAAKLAKLFGGDNKSIEAVLQKPKGEDGYVFESERHADLATHIGLPPCSVQLGYSYIAEGQLPEGMTAGQFHKIS